MAQLIMVISLIMKFMEKDYILGVMVKHIKDNGLKITQKGMESWSGLMEKNMKVISSLIKNMEKEN